MTNEHEQASEAISQATPTGYECRLITSPADFLSPGFELYLYNTTRHLATQRANQPFSIVLSDTRTQQVAALFHADLDGEAAVSLPNAPFGGLEFMDGISGEALGDLLESVEVFCRARNLSWLKVKLPPGGYDEKRFACLQEVYKGQGFEVANSFLNHHISVDNTPFVRKIHPSERKRLRKCQRAEFVAEEWENPDPARVYSFLAESRERQGYALSLDSAQLQKLLTRLPEEVKVFVVRDGAEIASLTVAIRVNRRVLYNFCPADNLDYRAFSPTVMLNCALYEYARNEGVGIIDLGVSLDHLGKEKASLVRFKENLGGRPSLKMTYQKAIA